MSNFKSIRNIKSLNEEQIDLNQSIQLNSMEEAHIQKGQILPDRGEVIGSPTVHNKSIETIFFIIGLGVNYYQR